ncbi:MAG: carbon-nitrogen hydrolase family protein, partial [Deltaproteobacteria bacterium]|nr:carbon-nitrogen hydrolase family protein [Deltaproteobacteria bacterium]
RRGDIVETYDKIHLFDVSIPNGPSFQESARVEPGDRVVTAEVSGLHLGLSICYDLRFPELYRKLASQGAEILLVPAAFLLHTGKDHWLPLLRARAIENQTYVLAANQIGAHTPRRSSYGKSCIIDPWGAVIAQVSDGPGVAVAELDLAYLREVRQQLPALDHRRL